MTYLIGVGAHGQDIISIWEDTGRHESELRLRDEHNNLYMPPSGNDAGPCYFGPYHPQVRFDMAKRLTRFWPDEALVHPTSKPGKRCILDHGVVVARNVALDHDVWLGEHTHVNYSASMTRTKVGKFCTISPGAVICGDVVIGDRVFVGAGAVVGNLVTIGDGAIIGAGAVVTRRVEPGQRVLPAAQRRENG